jgi:hypothetical protein
MPRQVGEGIKEKGVTKWRKAGFGGRMNGLLF